MQKLILCMINKPTPLEPTIFEGELTDEFFVEDVGDYDDIIRKAEPLVAKIADLEKTTVAVIIKKSEGGMVFNGYVQNRSLSGTFIS